MSKVDDVVEQTEEEHYEDWQYEESGKKANDFIEEVIMPMLSEFDYENEDGDYVYGTATFGLFIELLPLLTQLGYNKEDLLEQVEQYVDYVHNRVLH
jgi:hypothetical protein